MNFDLEIEDTRTPLPPFTKEAAIQKIRLAENAWNLKIPVEQVAMVSVGRAVARIIGSRRFVAPTALLWEFFVDVEARTTRHSQAQFVWQNLFFYC